MFIMSNDDRPTRILDAALRVFSRYGYRRTAMDDIAREAGLSRPALYQHFRNKEDVFASLARLVKQRTMADMAAAWASASGVETALRAAAEAKELALYRLLHATPHGGDLLEADEGLAADLGRAMQQEAEALIAAGLAAYGRAPGDAAALARLFVRAAAGAKHAAEDEAALARDLAGLARVFAQASPGPFTPLA